MPDSPFSPQALSKAVHDSLEQAYAAIPEGKNNVLIVDATLGGEKGARALYARRVGAGWNIALEGEWKGGDHVVGKVAAIKAW